MWHPALVDAAEHVPGRAGVGETGLADHGDARGAELQRSSKPLKRCLRLGASGIGCGDDPHRMAACRLFGREIANVAKKTSDGRPQDMQDAEPAGMTRPLGSSLAQLIEVGCGRSHQNQRSCTWTVSPGRIGSRSSCWKRADSPSTLRVTVTLDWRARAVNPPAMATAVSPVMSLT
jgi:hypothetical protein